MNNITANDLLIGKVKKALQQHADCIKSADIFLAAQGGAITLKGVVDTPQEREKAFMIASGVDGVCSVHNELRVLSEHDKTDPALGKTPHPGYDLSNDDQGCAPSGRVG